MTQQQLDRTHVGSPFKEMDGNQYSQSIAVYALSEAYALTKIPMLNAVRFPTDGDTVLLMARGATGSRLW